MNTPGGRKIGVLMSSDTLGHFHIHPQNSAPKVFPPGGGRKIATIGDSDTLGVLYAFPQNESPKHVAPFIDWWPADR